MAYKLNVFTGQLDLVDGAGGGGPFATASFTTINADLGTDPVAGSINSTLNLTSSDSSVIITGNAGTNTINFTVPAAAVVNSFVTIAVPAGTNPVADSSTDTLTYTSSDGLIVMTGTASTDTVDFTLGSGINANKIADGSVSNTEFQFINSVTSNVQTQLDAKQGTITIGALDAQAANATGLALVSNVLSTQSANATNPGMVNTTTQTFAGVKTFSSQLNADGGIDRGSSGTLSIGTTVNSTVINIGNSGATVNIIGTTLYENVTTLQVTDPLITLNKGGGAGSAQDSGIELEENALITAYVKTSLDRNSWLLKAPNTAGIVTITPGAGGFTIDQGSHNPVTLSAVGASPNANAATLTGQVLNLEPASASFPGVVTTGTQSFAGDKTFTGAISASNLSGTNTGNVTLTAVGATPNANGASLSGQALTLQPANTTFPGVLTAADWNTFNNKLTSTLADGNIFVGNASNVATSVNPTGDIDISNAGVFSINAGVIVNADINAAAAIDATKIADGTVSNAEFQFINSVTSNVQTQIDAKATSTNVQVFTSGSGNWTKPAGAKWVTVLMMGAGGGGGSGNLAASGTSTTGGSGGGGGVVVQTRYNASDLAATVAYAIGAGGTGGAAITGAAAAGNAGGVGGNTSFDGHTAYGGGGGSGGVAGANRAGGSGAGSAGAGNTGGAAGIDGGLPNQGQGVGISGGGAGVTAINTVGQPAEFGGAAGAGGQSATAGKAGGTSIFGGGGGGAGGGTNTTTTDTAGGAGGQVGAFNVLGGGGGAGGAAGAGGAPGAGTAGAAGLYNGAGGGGGGASALSTSNGAIGGAGGAYGGGGGGGGGGRILAGAGGSGAGGVGGSGVVIVTTFF